MLFHGSQDLLPWLFQKTQKTIHKNGDKTNIDSCQPGPVNIWSC